MKKLFTLLQNGHSGFRDDTIQQKLGYLPFKFRFVDNNWIVIKSYDNNLPVGSVLTHFSGIPIKEYYDEYKQYICASSEYERLNKFGSGLNDFLPKNFDLTTQNDQKRSITKSEKSFFQNYDEMFTEGRWITENELAYIKIPSFSQPKFEESAIVFVNQFFNSTCIIFDVRGNSGGATPEDLLHLIMDVPYRWWSEATTIKFGLFDYRAKEFKKMKSEQKVTDTQPSYMDGIADMNSIINNGSFLMTSEYEYPKDRHYQGKVIVLIDGYTASAAEDFTMPIKIFRKATIIGERTQGSTGQPYFYRNSLGIVAYASTKRTYFPNGDLFEGKGIEPTFEVIVTEEILLSKKDAVLDKAIELSKI